MQHVAVRPVPQYEPASGSEPSGEIAPVWKRHLAALAMLDLAEEQ